MLYVHADVVKSILEWYDEEVRLVKQPHFLHQLAWQCWDILEFHLRLDKINLIEGLLSSSGRHEGIWAIKFYQMRRSNGQAKITYFKPCLLLVEAFLDNLIELTFLGSNFYNSLDFCMF